MKAKFAGIKLDSVQVLTRQQLQQIKGGYGGSPWNCSFGGPTYPNQSSCVFNCVKQGGIGLTYGTCSCTGTACDYS